MPKRKVSAVWPASFSSLLYFCSRFERGKEKKSCARFVWRRRGRWGDAKVFQVLWKALRPMRFLTRLAFSVLLQHPRTSVRPNGRLCGRFYTPLPSAARPAECQREPPDGCMRKSPEACVDSYCGCVSRIDQSPSIVKMWNLTVDKILIMMIKKRALPQFWMSGGNKRAAAAKPI